MRVFLLAVLLALLTGCGGLSTALFVLGPEKAIELWRSAGGFEFILVTDTGSVIVSEALSECFTPSSERTVTIIPVSAYLEKYPFPAKRRRNKWR